MMPKKNGHAISVKYSLEVDFIFSLLIVQKGVCIPPLLREKVPTLISNGFEMIMNLSCSLLSPPIRMGKNPIGT
jgi:hypothetical protein